MADKDRGRPGNKGGPSTAVSPARLDEGIVSHGDDWRARRAALDRLQAQADHTRICRWLHQLAPLTVHYGPRRWAA